MSLDKSLGKCCNQLGTRNFYVAVRSKPKHSIYCPATDLVLFVPSSTSLVNLMALHIYAFKVVGPGQDVIVLIRAEGMPNFNFISLLL